MASMNTIAQAMARRRKPPTPPPRYANPNVVPGIGGYRRQVHERQRAARNMTFDGPAGGGASQWGSRQLAPFKPGQAAVMRRKRRPTRPYDHRHQYD